MRKNTFAQKAFTITLGAFLAFGIAPAAAFASQSGPNSNGQNSAGPNQFVLNQEKDPGWLTADNNGTENNNGPSNTHHYDVNNAGKTYAEEHSEGPSNTHHYDVNNPAKTYAEDHPNGPEHTHNYDPSHPENTDNQPAAPEIKNGNTAVKDYNADSDDKGKETTTPEILDGNQSGKHYNAGNTGDKIDRGTIVDGNQSGKNYDANHPGQNN